MSAVPCIAREEWRLMLRDRIAVLGFALLVLLGLIAALSAFEHRRATSEARAHYQSQVNREFDAQPDRHPHRMVHYGQFVFRPLNPWAAFDAGIDAYTGHTLFLEGHRQNSANFGDVRQSSLLLRFGQLTPAFVLQLLAPLLLVFVGHGVVAREREGGTLRILLAQGVKARDLVLGKLLAMAEVAGLVLLPAAAALAWIGTRPGVPMAPGLLLLVGHGAWLMLWAAGVVLVSSIVRRPRDALLALLALWTVALVLMPRIVPDAVNAALPLATRFETDIAVARELAALGDSHDPDDPYFSEFRRKLLQQHGVNRVEDLPLNYKGLVALEGERLTSELFERHAEASFGLQERQSRLVDRLGIVDPAIALRRLSMTAAGTDLDSYRRFSEQGERYRFALVQSLNRLQAEKLSYADDRNPARQNRVDRSSWHDLPDFRHEPEPTAAMLRRALPAMAVLLLWLAGAALLLPVAASRLGRVDR
ncbi:DUF3526 domain-containing protein [Variovorax saccharolyticus]|uniref:DUF3526 domain-containing protein n=1 Tax=Variovorax saccharolyticus TaxID=3053516 RepID=UPI002575D25A|nr:DUF3526 domain-containing protein [Variovorax sp. J22R187]MDM0018850.1 DUF3526 domain-containing protein [Variovorax sp. J22R187]